MILGTWLTLLRRHKLNRAKRPTNCTRPAQQAMLRCEQLEERTLLSATIRAATYNIEADINGDTTPRPGLYQVLEGIGEEQLQGDVQPLTDILALEETTSNSTTIAPIVSNLNSFYAGLAVYSQSPYQATQNGSNADGNGPNGLVYNTKTLNLLASVGVGTPEKGQATASTAKSSAMNSSPLETPDPPGFFLHLRRALKIGGHQCRPPPIVTKKPQIIRNDEATLPANAASCHLRGRFQHHRQHRCIIPDSLLGEHVVSIRSGPRSSDSIPSTCRGTGT